MPTQAGVERPHQDTPLDAMPTRSRQLRKQRKQRENMSCGSTGAEIVFYACIPEEV
jgi:hypothetical protein